MKNKYCIIIDVQNDFVSGSLANPAATNIGKNIQEYIENNSFDDTIFTKDTHYEDYLNTAEGKKLPIEHCIKNTLGWEIVDELKETAENSTILEKNTFGTLDWTSIIKDPAEIIICGLVTDICVVSNTLILKALFPNATVKVISDLCAGLTPEKHEAALEVMKSCQVEVI